MRSYLTFCCLLATLCCSAQENLNLELISNYPTSSSANDIWGYVDKDGVEYAIVGTRDDTNVFSLEDASAPELLLQISGSNTTWRDIKSYGNYLYSVTDNTGDGLTIIDMSNPSNGIPHSVYYPIVPDIEGDSIITSSHNLFVDENGILYMCGSNIISGTAFLDLNANPVEPPVIGYMNDEYAHDIYVRGDTLYASEIFKGELGIYDISDKNNVRELGRTETSFSFTHNAWLSDDGKTVYTTDERNNAFLDAYDISDMNNIRRISMIRPRLGGDGVMPHNTHYEDGYLITSWYGDGIIVIDAHKPDNLVIVARYDTNTESSVGSMGCWGAYPFLPSGRLIASDRQNGLFVFEPRYERAAYLEGCITDAGTGAGINDVSVEIQNTQSGGRTDANGNFKTGHGVAGLTDVLVRKDGYKPQLVSVDLVAGEVTELKLAMEAAAELTLDIIVVDAESGQPVPDAQLLISSIGFSEEAVTNSAGAYSTIVYEEVYDIIVGAWGYYHKLDTRNLSSSDPVMIEVDRGYQDDFLFDLGWTVPSESFWLRWFDVQLDVDGDLGEIKYTSYAPKEPQSTSSPAMDLTIYTRPVISFYARLNATGAFLVPSLSIDGEKIILEEILDTGNSWKQFSYEVNDFTSLDLSEVYIEFDHQVINGDTFHRADVDAFLVEEGMPSVTEELTETSFTARPTVTSSMVQLFSSSSDVRQLSVYNLKGELVTTDEYDGGNNKVELDFSTYEAGPYFIRLEKSDGGTETLKVIKI